jgi:hypothetical protein
MGLPHVYQKRYKSCHQTSQDLITIIEALVFYNTLPKDAFLVHDFESIAFPNGKINAFEIRTI